MKSKAALLLLPNLLGDNPHHGVFLPASVDRAVQSIDGLIAESESGGRRYLSRFNLDRKPQEVPIALYNKNVHQNDLDFLLEPIINGQRWGLVTDCGLPCLADPGHKLVYRARQLGITVQAFVGPSSIIMSLMLSGLPAQRFSFHGYIDKEPKQRESQIRQLEKESKAKDSTEIFMEAPHRNGYTLQALLENLHDQTHLCVAWDLTMPTQGIVCQPIAVWKKMALPNIDKKPALFLVYAT